MSLGAGGGRMEVLLLSGPNLGLLGEREPDVYGPDTLANLVEAATAEAESLGMGLRHVQSNHEGDLVDAIHAARGVAAGIVINPGALTHYAWSLHDALAAFDGPVIELHLSNPAVREGWRHLSVVASIATGTVAGLGAAGYPVAIAAVARLIGLAGERGAGR
ncbi:MAG: type II 3-dehydroquinate dehydratase [Acidimicrobiales bacterium]